MYFYDILFSFDFAALSPAPVGRKQHFELSVFVAFFSISSLSPSQSNIFNDIWTETPHRAAWSQKQVQLISSLGGNC